MEAEALRIVAPLLSESEEADTDAKPTLAKSSGVTRPQWVGNQSKPPPVAPFAVLS
jgi:hypothetical protein